MRNQHALAVIVSVIEEIMEYEEGEIHIDIDLDTGFLLLCTEGCGIYYILIVNTSEPSTYGTIWLYDVGNDFGIVPLFHPKTKKPLCFLEWLERWAR